jgi:hypothetical protein
MHAGNDQLLPLLSGFFSPRFYAPRLIESTPVERSTFAPTPKALH